MSLFTCRLLAPHLPVLCPFLVPVALLSASPDNTAVIQEFPLQAEIPADKAPMMQKEQAEQNVTFGLLPNIS